MIVQPFSFLSGSAGGDFCGGNQGLSVTTSVFMTLVLLITY